MTHLPEMAVYLHVPKVGGSALMDSFSEIFGASHLGHYKYNQNGVVPYNQSSETLSRMIEIRNSLIRQYPVTQFFGQLISRGFREIRKSRTTRLDRIGQDVLFVGGHLPFSEVERCFSGHPLITVVRDPLKRIESTYHNWKLVSGVTNWGPVTPQYDEHMTFQDFAEHPLVHSSHQHFLGRKHPQDFAVIGTTDNLQDIVNRVFKYAKDHQQTQLLEPPVVKRVNVRAGDRPTNTRMDTERFRQLYAEEYDFFKQVRRLPSFNEM